MPVITDTIDIPNKNLKKIETWLYSESNMRHHENIESSHIHIEPRNICMSTRVYQFVEGMKVSLEVYESLQC